MKFYICPKCQCVNDTQAKKCAGCGVDSLVILLHPNIQLLEHKSVTTLDKWLKLTKQMGMPFWRKT